MITPFLCSLVHRLYLFTFFYYKLLAETMHDVSNGVIPSQLKDLFFPTIKIHTYNTRSSVSNNSYIKKSKVEIERKSFSRIGTKLWNEIPTKLRTLPKLNFKKKIRMILLNILESEDSYEDLEPLSQKLENTLSSYHFLFGLSDVIHSSKWRWLAVDIYREP